MIRFYIWCAIMFPIIGYVYSFFTGNNDVFIFFSGMVNMLFILLVMEWSVEDRK